MSFGLCVLMALSMVEFVSDFSITDFVFVSGMCMFRVVNRHALFGCVVSFLAKFLFLSLANCHSSALPSSYDEFEEAK